MEDYPELAELLQDPSWEEVIEGLDVFTTEEENLYEKEEGDAT